MSQPEPTKPEPTSLAIEVLRVEAKNAIWSRKQWLLYVALPVALLSLLIGGPIEHLLFGWCYFLLRTIPKVSIDIPTAMLGLVSATTFVTGLHYTLLWFVKTGSVTSVTGVNWSWRSTSVVAVTVVLMFTAGTAMVGATHQFVWLLTGHGGRSAQEPFETQRVFGFFANALEQARRTTEKNNLKHIGFDILSLCDSREMFPPGGTMDESGTLLHGWVGFLVNSGTYFAEGIDFAVPWNQAPNDRIYQCALPTFINPSMSGPRFDEQGYGLSHVAGNVHVLPICQVNTESLRRLGWSDTVKKSDRAVGAKSITDGTSNTIMIGTVGERFKPWGYPANVRDPALGINRHSSGFGGPRHWNGAMFLMCDGSVKFFSNETDPQVMKALGTPAGGESLPSEITSR